MKYGGWQVIRYNKGQGLLGIVNGFACMGIEWKMINGDELNGG